MYRLYLMLNALTTLLAIDHKRAGQISISMVISGDCKKRSDRNNQIMNF